MSSKVIVRKDLPIFADDFQASAERQGFSPRLGTRLFREINMRGWLYNAAKTRSEGRELSIRDEGRLGDRSPIILDIYYLDDEGSQGAVSLNGLRRTIRMGLLDQVVDLEPELKTARTAVLGDVIATMLVEQHKLTQYEVE